MAAVLKVRWRGVVYDVRTCLNDERAALAASRWPDGVIEIARMLDSDRESPFSEKDRRALVKMTLRALGESVPTLRDRVSGRLMARRAARASRRGGQAAARSSAASMPPRLDATFLHELEKREAPKARASSRRTTPGVKAVTP